VAGVEFGPCPHTNFSRSLIKNRFFAIFSNYKTTKLIFESAGWVFNCGRYPIRLSPKLNLSGRQTYSLTSSKSVAMCDLRIEPNQSRELLRFLRASNDLAMSHPIQAATSGTFLGMPEAWVLWSKSQPNRWKSIVQYYRSGLDTSVGIFKLD
jgi:hypothetical protein